MPLVRVVCAAAFALLLLAPANGRAQSTVTATGTFGPAILQLTFDLGGGRATGAFAGGGASNGRMDGSFTPSGGGGEFTGDWSGDIPLARGGSGRVTGSWSGSLDLEAGTARGQATGTGPGGTFSATWSVRLPAPRDPAADEAARAAEERRAAEARSADRRAAELVASAEARQADVDLYREVPLFLPPGSPPGRSLIPEAPPDRVVVAPWAADRGDGALVPGPTCMNLTGVCVPLAPGQEIPNNAELRLSPGFSLDLTVNGHAVTVTTREEGTVVRQQQLVADTSTPMNRLLSALDAPIDVPTPRVASVTVESGAIDLARVEAEGAAINLALDVQRGRARLTEYADTAVGTLRSVTEFVEGTRALITGERVVLDVGTVVAGDGCGAPPCEAGAARSLLGSFWRAKPEGTGYSATVDRDDVIESVTVGVARGLVTVEDVLTGATRTIAAGSARVIDTDAWAGRWRGRYSGTYDAWWWGARQFENRCTGPISGDILVTLTRGPQGLTARFEFEGGALDRFDGCRVTRNSFGPVAAVASPDRVAYRPPGQQGAFIDIDRGALGSATGSYRYSSWASGPGTGNTEYELTFTLVHSPD